MVQNQLLFMCQLDRCFLAIIITEEKLEKQKRIKKPKGWPVQTPNKQTGYTTVDPQYALLSGLNVLKRLDSSINLLKPPNSEWVKFAQCTSCLSKVVKANTSCPHMRRVKKGSQTSVFVSIIPTLRRLGQEECEVFEFSRTAWPAH